jgi:transposase InsO family protein/dUTPase
MRGMSIGTQRGGVTQDEQFQATASRTAKQAICYALWKTDQAAPAEDLINDDYIIPIEQCDVDRLGDFVDEIDRLPPTTTHTQESLSSTSSQSNEYNPLYQAANQSGDSLGILPATNTYQTWNRGIENTASAQSRLPPLYNQPTNGPRLETLLTGAAGGYFGASVAQNSHEPPPPRLPNLYNQVGISQQADSLSTRRRRRRLPYTYDGIGELEAFTFISNYHHVTQYDSWPDHEKVTYFSDHLTGKALQWYTMQFSEIVPDYANLRQEFLDTYAPQQNPLYYTSRLRNATKQPFPTVQAYIATFEEVLRTSPPKMITQHDAIQIFLMELPESLKMELTLQPCNTIKDVIARTKFITHNRACFLGRELPASSPRSTPFNRAASYSNKTSLETRARDKTRNNTAGLKGSKYCTYHKSKTHSNEECRMQQQANSKKSTEHHVDIATPIQTDENKSSTSSNPYPVTHVGINTCHNNQLPLAMPIIENSNTEFLWTTASAATVTVVIDGLPITAILDTGCAGVTLSTRILSKIKQKPVNISNVSIYTAERNTTTSLGFRRFKFQLGNETIFCPAIVLHNNSYDMLLSTNILSHLQAKIDFSTSQMTLPNSKIPFNWKPIHNQAITSAYIAPPVQPLKVPMYALRLQTNKDLPTPKVKYFQLYPQINTSFSPSQGTLYLNSVHPIKLEPQQYLKVATGLTIDIPEGMTGLICNHHWSTQMGLTVVTGMLYPKTYSNLSVLMVNNTERSIEVPPNQRIAILQLLTTPNITFEQEVTAPTAFTIAPNLANKAKLETTINNSEDFKMQASKLLEHLKPTEKASFIELIKSFTSLFQNDLKKPGAVPFTTHTIETGNAVPFRSKAYTRSHRDIEIEYEEIQKMLKAGVIVPSRSPWTSPVVLVSKKDGTVRFCVDYRKLNQLTKKDSYPLPRIDLMLEKFHDIEYFSTLDLTSGYWQVPMDPTSQEKTAFTSNHGIFEFKVMPFGLTNAPSSFQRLMDEVLQPILGKFVLVYLDDLIIFSKDLPQHIVHLKTVFELLDRYNLKVKLKKCSLAKKELVYLGYKISNKGKLPDESKVEAVQKMRLPKTVKELQAFLGLVNYYRCFIPNLSTIGNPLFELLKKNTRFQINPSHLIAIDKLKQILTSAPLLAYPDFSKPFIVHTDASTQGLGAILCQINSQGQEQPIAYVSCTLTRHEKNYTITELECLAILFAIRKFHYYLHGREFDVVTDHSALQWLLNLKDSTGRLARWSLKLQCYNFVVKHRAGIKHQNADCLSRLVSTVMPTDLNDTEAIIYYKQHGQIPENWVNRESELEKLSYDLIEKDSNLYKITKTGNYRLFINENEQVQVANDAHIALGHIGTRKLIEYLREQYYWPKMDETTLRVVSSCTVCQLNQGKALAQKMYTITTDYIFEKIGIDFVGPLPTTSSGKRYIFVMIDMHSRWVEAFATKDQLVSTMSQCLLEYISRYGCPRQIFSDRGTTLTSKAWKGVLKELQLEQRLTASYMPSTNGAVERANQTLVRGIRKLAQHKPTTWDRFLPQVLMGMRLTKNQTTKLSPYEIIFQQSPTIPVKLLNTIPRFNNHKRIKGALSQFNRHFQELHQNLQEFYNSQKKYPPGTMGYSPYTLGQKVLWKLPVYLRRGKLIPQWCGPCTISKCNPTGSYSIVIDETGDEYGNVHFQRLKPFNLPLSSLRGDNVVLTSPKRD